MPALLRELRRAENGVLPTRRSSGVVSGRRELPLLTLLRWLRILRALSKVIAELEDLAVDLEIVLGAAAGPVKRERPLAGQSHLSWLYEA